jgi:alpha-glucosidase
MTLGKSSSLANGAEWWRTAVVYEIYPRSFRDSDGDGVGDLEGVRESLPYLESLGIDAIWFTPWYASPLADGGYDVEDYRKINPVFGTLEQAEVLIREAAERGIRTIIDIVPNHVSAAHPWFAEALAAEPGSDARGRFWFHPGHGPGGEHLPTRWKNNFAGDVWTRIPDPDGRPGEWYLHLFASEQPDLNWNHPDVVREHEEVLRFWFDRGVAGIRIDSAAHIMKDPALPEDDGTHAPGAHPNLDRDEVHPVYRRWREIADSYEEPRVLVGEVWLPEPDRFARYLDGEMHTAFNFDLMTRPWSAGAFRESIDLMLTAHASVGAPCTWVLSNHDVTRPVTRYGRADTGFSFDEKAWGIPSNAALGLRRARAAALLVAALPGSLYIYQGDELGLPEVEDLDRSQLQDPMYLRSHGLNPGRDGCRVPLPWSGTTQPFGFSPPDAATPPWLSQPTGWRQLSVEAQDGNPESTLSLYRRSLGIRRRSDELRAAAMTWLDSDPSVCAFSRGGFISITNFGSSAVDLDASLEVILASGPLGNDGLPSDTTVWVRSNSNP